MRSPVVPLLLALLASLPALPTSAQMIRGRFVEEGSEAPVVGGFVSLLDREGQRVVGVLSLEGGRFLLRLPGPGEYRLRGERIGFESVERPVRADGEEGIDIVLRAPSRAIQLEGIVASADRRCRVRPGAGVAAAVLWEEARKVLDAVDLLAEGTPLPVQLISWERELDPRSLRVRREERRVQQGFALDPIRSLPAEDLARNGFIRANPDGSYTYYGPDMQVLLSDPFLDGHCFRVEEGRGEAEGMVGLAFEPVDRTLPDIQGTLWLDRETAQLRYLEYGYTRYPWPLEDERSLGGRVEFERRGDGRWFVRRWWIRMPRVGVSPGAMRRAVSLQGILEGGSEVVDARPDGGWQIPSLRGSVEGVVMDGTRLRPLGGARVYVSGTSFAADTGPDGRFRIDGLRPGVYGLSFAHLRADELGHLPGLVDVEVQAGEVAEVVLEVPMTTLTEDSCNDGMAGVVWGTVRQPESGAPVAGAHVAATWNTFAVQGDWARSGVLQRPHVAEVRADHRGVFRLCGLPDDRDRIRLWVQGEGVTGREESVTLGTGEIRQVDLVAPGGSRP